MKDSTLPRIAQGRTDLVFDYLAKGGDAQATDPHGTRLIQWCAYYGDTSAIRQLLAHGETLAALGDNFDLNGAVFHGHWRLCQFLLEAGADPNFPLEPTQEVPLHAALCKANRPAYDHVIRVLLAAGAEVQRVTRPGVLTGSFMRDCRTRGETPLHRAAAVGSRDAIRLLIDAGAVVDAADVNGDTALSWASWANRPAYILAELCYGEHRIHPKAVEQSMTEHAQGWGGMERHLLGEPIL